MDDTLYQRSVPFAIAWEKIVAPLMAEAYANDTLNQSPGTDSCFSGSPALSALQLDALYWRYMDFGNEVFQDFMTGRMTKEGMFRYRIQKAASLTGLSLTDRQAMDFQEIFAWNQTHFCLTAPIREMLEEIHRSGCFMGIVTNGDSQHQRDKYTGIGLDRWIDPEHFLASGDVGVSKPDPEILRIAQDRWKLEPEQTWYVGDSYGHDISTALSCGWNTVYLNRRNYQYSSGEQPAAITVHSEEELKQAIEKLLSAT